MSSWPESHQHRGPNAWIKVSVFLVLEVPSLTGAVCSFSALSSRALGNCPSCLIAKGSKMINEHSRCLHMSLHRLGICDLQVARCFLCTANAYLGCNSRILCLHNCIQCLSANQPAKAGQHIRFARVTQICTSIHTCIHVYIYAHTSVWGSILVTALVHGRLYSMHT